METVVVVNIDNDHRVNAADEEHLGMRTSKVDVPRGEVLDSQRPHCRSCELEYLWAGAVAVLQLIPVNPLQVGESDIEYAVLQIDIHDLALEPFGIDYLGEVLLPAKLMDVHDVGAAFKVECIDVDLTESPVNESSPHGHYLGTVLEVCQTIAVDV